MELLQIIVLAVIQGITEFLPISSSAHLILVPILTGWPDQGLGFDLAVHLGTLSAVVYYFRQDLVVLACDCFASLKLRRSVGESRLAWAVILGTVPVGLAGLLFDDAIETTLRVPQVIVMTTIGFGVLLWWADARARGRRSEHELTWTDVAVIGIGQALALVPGTSRSGITITAGLLVGLSRMGAARYSFLLAIPVTALAGMLKMLHLTTGAYSVDWPAFLLGALISGVTAFLVIHYFLKFLGKVGLWPYVVYRFFLGGILLLYIYG